MAELQPISASTPVVFSKSFPSEALRRFAAIAPFFAQASSAVGAPRQKLLLAGVLAHQAGVSPRTLRRWRRAYKRCGLAALSKIVRADKGRPRFGLACGDFLLRVGLSSSQRGRLRPTAAAVYRAYISEASWRRAHAGREVAGNIFSKVKYSAWIDGAGRLRPDAMMPEISCQTIRYWFRRLPEIAVFLDQEVSRKPHTIGPRGSRGRKE
jgi:hypothetical protein